MSVAEHIYSLEYMIFERRRKEIQSSAKQICELISKRQRTREESYIKRVVPECSQANHESKNRCTFGIKTR